MSFFFLAHPVFCVLVELSRFRSRRLSLIIRSNVDQNRYNPSYMYIKLESEINFQNAVTFVLVKLDTKFKVQNS